MLGVPVLLYAVLCVAARLGYRMFLYPAPGETGLAAPILPDGARMLEPVASDGVRVHALQLSPPDDRAAARTAVLFHGNGETIANGIDIALDLRRRGFGAVLVEYRGYGASRGAGRPSEPGIYRDAVAVLDALSAQGIGADRIVLLGISLGTGVAAEMARRGLGASLVLVSPYTSITAMARRVAPFLPIDWVCPDRFDTLSKAKDIRTPTLVVHGDADEVIPVAMGRAVAGAIPGAALHVVAGGHHNDLFERWQRPVMDAIARHASRRN